MSSDSDERTRLVKEAKAIRARYEDLNDDSPESASHRQELMLRYREIDGILKKMASETDSANHGPDAEKGALAVVSESTDEENETQERRECPYCGEKILAVAKKCHFCGEWLGSKENSAIPVPVAPPLNAVVIENPRFVAKSTKNHTACGVCSSGVLRKKKKYRMSGAVVAIGYITLIPTILGMIIGGILLIATIGATSTTSEGIEEAIRQQLSESDIPGEVAQKIQANESLTESELLRLTVAQRNVIDSIESTRGAMNIGVGIAATMGVGVGGFVFVVSFVGGLLGWLLIMKKTVLQCSSCGAVVNAS